MTSGVIQNPNSSSSAPAYNFLQKFHEASTMVGVNQIGARALLLEIQSHLRGDLTGDRLFWRVCCIIEFARSYPPLSEERKCEAEIAQRAVDTILLNISKSLGEKGNIDTVAVSYWLYHSIGSLIPQDAKRLRQGLEEKKAWCTQICSSFHPEKPLPNKE